MENEVLSCFGLMKTIIGGESCGHWAAAQRSKENASEIEKVIVDILCRVSLLLYQLYSYIIQCCPPITLFCTLT